MTAEPSDPRPAQLARRAKAARVIANDAVVVGGAGLLIAAGGIFVGLALMVRKRYSCQTELVCTRVHHPFVWAGIGVLTLCLLIGVLAEFTAHALWTRANADRALLADEVARHGPAGVSHLDADGI